MKSLLVAVLATAGLALSADELVELKNNLVPAAQESVARYSLTALHNAATIEATMAGSVDVAAFYPAVVASTANRDALRLVPNGIRWSDGDACFELIGGAVGDPIDIHGCE